MIVADIVAARDQLVAAGIEVGEFFHIGPDGRVSGLDPEGRSYSSRASFSDPDGNVWLLQEITTRLPGRVDPGATSFGSASDLTARSGVQRPPTASMRISAYRTLARFPIPISRDLPREDFLGPSRLASRKAPMRTCFRLPIHSGHWKATF